MDTWIALAISSAIGLLGVVIGIRANVRAKKANEIAQHSNKIAENALGEAKKANRIAENANKLSDDANKVIALQAAQQVENWHVDWDGQWDGDRAEIVLVNNGRDTAHNVSVLIRSKGVNELRDRQGDIPRLGELRLAFPQFVEERIRQNRAAVQIQQPALDSGIVSPPQLYRRTLVLLIRWTSNLGNPGEKILNIRIK